MTLLATHQASLQDLRAEALALADRAQAESDPIKRRDLEQRALRVWQEARKQTQRYCKD